MRRQWILGAAVILGLSALPSVGRAQFGDAGTFNDPFFLYYGWFLPRQAALAAQPGPSMAVNTMAANRQAAALTERAGLYDPVSPFGPEIYDPAHPFANRTRGVRARRPVPRTGLTSTNINGNGPAGYYGGASAYFPTLRTGRATNAGMTVGTTPGYGARRNYGGGYGMPGASVPQVPGGFN